MKNKWIFISILFLAELLVLAAIGLVVWQGVNQTQLGSFGLRLNNDVFSAESEEEWVFEAGEITAISLESSGGDVVVEASRTDQIQVTAHKTAWHSTKARAQAELEDLSVIVTQTANKIIIKYRREPAVFGFGTQQIDTVDFIILIPEGLDLTAQTGFGEISVSGTIGEGSLATEFGSIDLSGPAQSLVARSNSGDISVDGLKGEDAQIDLSTDFGEISLSRSEGKTVLAHTNSGSITLENVTAADQIELSSDFGKLEFKTGGADILVLETNSGKVILNGIQVETSLTIRNDFGDITLEKTSADLYDLDTNSGSVSAEISGGNIKAASDFGDIDIQSSQPATVDLFTKSGSVEYSGPLGAGPHSLVTDFGDIKMYLPRDTAITFDLETDFGKLKTEFPITLEGDVKPDHWNGTINDGGAELTANTNSGDISFEFLTR